MIDETNNAVVNETDARQHERGQSIVLIAFAMIGLLALVGIAVDVGLVYARSTQLQAAVDAAVLAGVTEIEFGGLNAANLKAGQFLNSNNLPQIAIDTMQATTTQTALNATEYTITVTWPVDLFFLRVIGRDQANVTKSATAAYFPLADIYASRRVDNGVVSTSNQSVFGPNICVNYGDPYSPISSPYFPGPYTYNYRILIPPDYSHDIVRVELFDPDSINSATNTVTAEFTNYARAADPATYPIGGKQMNCSSTDRKNPCLIETELPLHRNDPNNVGLDQINPYWFVRIDENRGTGSPPGNNTCGAPGSYDPRYNTQTLYQLFYYRQNADGTIQRVDLASYTGQVGDGVIDNGEHQTDMRWVSPGGTPNFDQPVFVPADPGSPKDFEVSISQDLPGIVTDPNTGNRYLYLDVTAIRGSSENGFEIWAGPNTYIGDVPSDVNQRNIYILNNANAHNSEGVTVFGMGNLPMNSNYGFPVDIPLIYLGPEFAGQTVLVQLFDADSGAQPPIIFYFDTIAFEPDDSAADGVNWALTDWAKSYNQLSNGNGTWYTYTFTVPDDSNCDYSNPTMDTCTPFYGGRLTVRYQAGNHDTYGWQIRVTGLPYLVR